MHATMRERQGSVQAWLRSMTNIRASQLIDRLTKAQSAPEDIGADEERGETNAGYEAVADRIDARPARGEG
jgi:hypothetical protein